ncbi:MAG TPA: HEAT repeat domain-containing protein [Gemmatimonadales bacterium]|nr:HEAT repeat domain-containing protein [Gemmatimonadales bacterium]
MGIVVTTVAPALALAGLMAGLLASAAEPLAAQSLAERVAAAPEGAVRFHFAARPGVCGDGRHLIRHGRHGVMIRGAGPRGTHGDDCVCGEGPVRITLTLRDRRVTALAVAVGADRAGAGTDLGAVAAGDAARYLLDLASSRSPAAGDAVFPATLADSVVVWPDLLRLARNHRADRTVRKQAVFWLGQAAGDEATEGLAELAGSDREDREVREHAVFALSRLDDGRGVEPLIRIARTNRDPEIRRKALFWLGESEDPRALALFEELLTGR